jgi:ABC-type antimicrobial peptide transport system permease subunit
MTGRDFYSNPGADSNNIIINESLAKLMGKHGTPGNVIINNEKRYQVIGIVKDFVFNDVYNYSEPVILFCSPSNTNIVTIRFKDNIDLTDALSKIAFVIKNYNPGYPFEYRFVDEDFHQLFKTETLIGELAGIFSMLAVTISCLGLFGLAAYTAERRTKEIGIRKVLGASVKGIAGLLSKDFLQLVFVSCIVAFPFAWFAMDKWLQNYSYRIEISWWIFLVAGVLAILIALFTVSFQAIKAALANPVKSLRTE